MKRKLILGLVGVCVVASVEGCASPPSTIPDAAPVSSTCPPDGSSVPFGKVMNTGFVESYEGCNITTTAKFIGAGLGAMYLGGLENNYLMIRVVAPGEQIPTGLQSPNYVALPKVGSDLVFQLKSGDMVTLTGGTKYNGTVPTLSVFIANSIARSR